MLEVGSREAGKRELKLLVRAVVVIVTVVIVAESGVDVGGIAGVDAMSRRGMVASVRRRRGPMPCRRSSMRSRVG